jgi:hypothetical protein
MECNFYLIHVLENDNEDLFLQDILKRIFKYLNIIYRSNITSFESKTKK